jgi:hypothetical protein
MDNFLKDDIPINEHILAMKNKFNSTKVKLEEQYKNLNLKKGEAHTVLNFQKIQVQTLHEQIKGNRKQKNNRR